MRRYAFLALAPTLALGVPAFAQQQMAAAGAQALTQAPPVSVRTDPATGAVIETITLPPGTPLPPKGEAGGAIAMTATPRFEWVPGHYNWDLDKNQYVWMVGQYVQLPRVNARWVPGDWRMAPNGVTVWAAGHFE